MFIRLRKPHNRDITMVVFNKQSFLGGFNQQVDATRLEDSEYPLMFNGRNRYDYIKPVNLPLEITDAAFTGKKLQGIYSIGSVLIVFANGEAWYKNQELPNSFFNQIPDVAMSATADIIYAELIPTSSTNFTRVPITSGQQNTDIILVNPITASPSGLVVQDNLNQPIIILSNLIARTLNTYNDWSYADREYVPIGGQMLYSDGKLYIVSGSYIYQSVTGRPLDFVVVLDGDGNKLATEDMGGALATAFSVDFNPITCISRLNTNEANIFVSTSKAAYTVALLTEPQDLIFGEPDYEIRFLFTTGCTSPFSFLELLGDNALIDFNGLRSFNAVGQLYVEGKNSVFSAKVGPLLNSVVQDYTAAINFDNYAFFAVNTVYGRGIIVYDTINKVYVSLDLYPGISQVIKFEEVRTLTERRLFFITTDNKIYEAFKSEEVAVCKLYVGDWCSNDANIELKPWQLKLVFVDSLQDGIVTASIYSDRRFGGSLSSEISQKLLDANDSNLVLSIGNSEVDTVQIVDFDFTKKGLIGWKHGFLISWNIDAKLTHIKFSAVEDVNISAANQQASRFKQNRIALNSLT